MTIWLLAIILVLALAGLGYRQGAIRVSFSLIGIIMGTLLAVPLGKPAAILLKAFGVAHPVLLWLVPPVIVFCLVSAIFKGIALAVHHKVEVYFKYKAGDLRLTLWERLNRRLGLCLGIVNGIGYLVLISFIIYILSYWTVLMETSGETRKTVQLLNRAGKDLHGSGFVKTARALDRLPESYYAAADIVGLLYQNNLLEARLARYPAFLMLGERPDFQALAKDQQFSEMRARQDSLSELLAYGPVNAIVNNPETLQTIWGIVEPDLKDLKEFLESARSPKYDPETLLGRWNCNVRSSVAALRRAKPNLTAAAMLQERQRFQALYSNTRMVVGTGNELVMKDYPNLKIPPTPNTPLEFQSGPGKWTGANGFYQLTFTLGGDETKGSAAIEGSRMTLTIGKLVLMFEREF